MGKERWCRNEDGRISPTRIIQSLADQLRFKEQRQEASNKQEDPGFVGGFYPEGADTEIVLFELPNERDIRETQ